MYDLNSNSNGYRIDRKFLRTIEARFLQYNEQRIERALSLLNNYQQVFLEALPVLLHVNHPLLPGYITTTTPYGISEFEPNKQQIRAVKNIVRSFYYKPLDDSDKCAIQNLSLMGSCGTIAQFRNSDMDFWVCYSPDLTKKQIRELNNKLEAIAKWASGFGLEVYFFLMNVEQFRAGTRSSQLSSEDCGSSQHYLLLDEFYRTSLLIAGCFPVWWLVPPELDKNYLDCIEKFKKKRFIVDGEYIDFGGVDQIPAGEFIGAGLWQLYKGIDSPYKSVLKIMLTEIYANEYPAVTTLSNIFKKAIYDGCDDLMELDPYVMLYRKLASYLELNGEEQRLELLRRCLYFKIGEQMSRPTSKATILWRRQLMGQIIDEWGWTRYELVMLDARKHWKVQQVVKERNLLVNELNTSYHFLSRFAEAQTDKSLINQQDMDMLGRKLYAAFERKSGKIELVNPNISPDVSEEYLTLFFLSDEEAKAPEGQVGEQNLTDITSASPNRSDIYRDSENFVWVAFTGKVHRQEILNRESVKRSRSLIEVISWCYFNRVIDTATRIILYPGRSDLTETELNQHLSALRQIFPSLIQSANQSNFLENSRIELVTLFINVGEDPLREWNVRGIHKITERTDALNFGGLHNNLVHSIEQITLNSWHEIITNKFIGPTAVVDCILDFLKYTLTLDNSKMPKREVVCFCQSRPKSISKRIENLFNLLIECFKNTPNGVSGRFILEVEHKFYIFRFSKNNIPGVKCTKNFKQLVKYLGSSQTRYSPIYFDELTLKNHVLVAISKNFKAKVVQVFCHQKNKSTTEIYISDEKGSLVYCHCNKKDKNNFLSRLNQFLQTIWYRQKNEIGSHQCALKLLFYNVILDVSAQCFHFEKMPNLVKKQNRDNKLTVGVLVSNRNQKRDVYTIYCNEKEFSELKYGAKLFSTVAEYIVSQREGVAKYPVYISDIDLTQASDEAKVLQTCQYMQQKIILENQLNKALDQK